MRRLMTALVIFSLVVSYFAVLSSTTVSAAADQICWVFDVDVTNNLSSPATATIFFYDLTTFQVYTTTRSLTLNPGQTGTLRLAAFVPAGRPIGPGGGPGGLSFSGFKFQSSPSSQCDFGHIDDGRINAYDLAAPLAAYCTPDHGIAVWHIDDSGHGTLAFTSSAADISAALSKAIASGQNVLVGQGMGDSLYALSSNQLTLTGPDVKESGKTYDFITTPDRCN